MEKNIDNKKNSDNKMNIDSKKKITAIVLAAGQGKRMNSCINKQFLLIYDKPIIVYTIELFINNPLITDILLVVSEDELYIMQDEIINHYFNSCKKEITLVIGGKERYNSVYNALSKIDLSTDYILIHDGARPLLLQENINRLVRELETSEACVLGVKAKDTFKVVDSTNTIITTVNRDELYSIQTPQAFHTSIIVEAYTKGILNPEGITDDSMMVERFTNYPIKLINGEYSNIKITTQDDLLLMEKILMERLKI